jgi:CPA2 family monovalent cation:H+ antiporter-2
MDGWSLLLELVAVLAASFFFGAIFERIRLGAVVGYLLAGVLIGPFALGVVQSMDVVLGLAELGVALLLFSTGLEFSPYRLRKLGRSTLKAGTAQLLITILFFTVIALASGLEWRQSLAVGMIVSVSSTAIVLRQLRERGELDAPHGKLSLGILLIQDVALIPLVLGMTALASRAESDAQVRPTPVAIAGMIIVAAVILTRFLPRALRSQAMTTNRELPILLGVVTCAGAAYAAHWMGMSPSLGAFIAGMLLAETSFEHQIRSDVAPLKALFGTVFFASVGMLADVRWIAGHLWLVFTAVVLLLVAKGLSNFIAVRPWRFTTTVSIAAALSLAQVGELGFILLQVAGRGGLLDQPTIQLLTSVIVVSMLVSPLLVVRSPRIARRLARWIVPPRRLAREEIEAQRATLQGHFVVAGFGTAGRTATKVLGEAQYQVLVVDLDPKIVRTAPEHGAIAKVGDATQTDLLLELNLNSARGLILAIPDYRSASLVIAHARQIAPELPIVARSRNHPYAEELKQAGADLVIGEEQLLGRRLGEEAARLAHGAIDDEVRDAP